MIKKRKITKKDGFLTGIIILVSIIDLVLLFYFKYHNQGLPIAEFKLSYIGNIINLIFTVLLVVGIILYLFLTKHGFKPGFLISFTIILNIILFLAFISTLIKLPLPYIYILDHPLHKIFIGALFSLYQLVQLIFLSILWYSVIGRELVILRAIVNSIMIVSIILVLTFIYINTKKSTSFLQNNKIKSKDKVAVVLGAAVWSHNSPSPSLAARVDKALELYEKGIVNKIQLTGSNAPGEMSEAEVAFNYINLNKINSKDIWLEDKTISTTEQISFIKDSLIIKKRIHRIIIVSDAYHLTRVMEICKFYNIKTGIAASNLKLSFEHNFYYKTKESIALLVFWLFAL